MCRVNEKNRNKTVLTSNYESYYSSKGYVTFQCKYQLFKDSNSVFEQNPAVYQNTVLTSSYH